MLKRIALILSLITVAIYGTVFVGALVTRLFDNDNLKPGKEYVTDYVSPTSPYAVRTLYDENSSPIDIVVVDAKSGVLVAGIKQDAYEYKITEVSSTITFVLYDNEGVAMGTYEFDTEKGELIDI